MTLPIMVVLVPPRMLLLTKSEATGTKVISTPADTPGSDSGNTTLRKALARLANRSWAASTRLGSTRSRATYSGRTMNGRELVVRAPMKAGGGGRRGEGCGDQ